MVLLEGRDAQNPNPFNCSFAPSMAIPSALMFQEEGSGFPWKKLTFPLSLSLSQSTEGQRKYSQQGSALQVSSGDNCRNLVIQHFTSETDIKTMEWKQTEEQTEGSVSQHTRWEGRD